MNHGVDVFEAAGCSESYIKETLTSFWAEINNSGTKRLIWGVILTLYVEDPVVEEEPTINHNTKARTKRQSQADV